MFLKRDGMEELAKYKLAAPEWDALELFQSILQVNSQWFASSINLNDFQVPQAFQQQLSSEKTPTLCNAFPAFKGMKRVWKEHQVEHLETSDVVQEGLNKLDDYRDRADHVPAYVLAMYMYQFLFSIGV